MEVNLFLILVVISLWINNVYCMDPNDSIEAKLKELDDLVARSFGVDPKALGVGGKVKPPDEFTQDEVLYTREQTEYLINLVKTEGNAPPPGPAQKPSQLLDDSGSKKPPRKRKTKKNRKKPRGKKSGRGKRKVTDFVQFPAKRWEMPIAFKIASNVFNFKKKLLLDAIDHWEKNTCLKFKHIEDADQIMNGPHLKFVADPNCASLIGEAPLQELWYTFPDECAVCPSCYCPQIVRIGLCRSTGMIIHEIGHAVGGFVHEQARMDRNRVIKINGRNIQKGRFRNFLRRNDTRTLLVPYDVGSVMHYPSIGFSSDAELTTIDTIDPLFQRTMGQRVRLSFYDKLIVSKDYCRGVCKPLTCKRGGFANPSDCSKCICPDGFDGRFCEVIAKSSPTCQQHPNSKIVLNDQRVKCIDFTPKSGGVFECNLLIQTQATWKIQILNVTTDLDSCDFDNHCCQNFGEIKFKNDLVSTGARFCGRRKARQKFVSEKNEVMIILANHTPNPKKTFVFCLKAV